jgi:hypothetical protein
MQAVKAAKQVEIGGFAHDFGHVLTQNSFLENEIADQILSPIISRLVAQRLVAFS